MSRSKPIVLSANNNLQEKLEELKIELGEISIPKTIMSCIEFTYAHMTGKDMDNKVDIVKEYKDTMKNLRKRHTKLTSLILNAGNDEERDKYLKELDQVNKMVKNTKDIARTEGDFNDLMFDTVSKGRYWNDFERNVLAKERNEILKDTMKHRIMMDFNKEIIDEGGADE